MEYSDENLMNLISQISYRINGHMQKNSHEDHKHEEGRTSEGRIGYPNCPGPGCGNGCPYKGTDDCPKVVARKAGDGNTAYEGENHGPQKGETRQGKEEHEHPDGGYKRKGHGGHGEEEGCGEHGHHGHGEHYGHDDNHHECEAAHSPMGRDRILTILSEENSISQCALAGKLGIRPQSVSELLGKLETDGYIVRTQNDQDKRETLVSLSTEGEKRAEEVKSLQEKRTAEFLAPLNEEEKQNLFALLIKLTGESMGKQ